VSSTSWLAARLLDVRLLRLGWARPGGVGVPVHWLVPSRWFQLFLGHFAFHLATTLLRAQFEEGFAHGRPAARFSKHPGRRRVRLSVEGISCGFACLGATRGVEEREGDDDTDGDVVVLEAGREIFLV